MKKIIFNLNFTNLEVFWKDTLIAFNFRSKEVLASLVLIVILISINQGQHFFRTLIENVNGLNNNPNFSKQLWLAFLTMFSVFALGFSFWVKPIEFGRKPFRKYFNRLREKIGLPERKYPTLKDYYKEQPFSKSFIATFPAFIYAFALITANNLFSHNKRIWVALFFIGLAYFLICYLLHLKGIPEKLNDKLSDKINGFWALMGFFITSLVTLFFIFIVIAQYKEQLESDDVHIKILKLCLYLPLAYAFSIIHFLFFRVLSLRIIMDDNRQSARENNLRWFRGIILFLICVLFIYIMLNRFYLGIGGLGVLVHIPVIIAVYFILWDFAVYNYKELSTFITTFGFIAILFCSSFESCNRHHFMNVIDNKLSEKKERDNIDDYTHNWILSRYRNGICHINDTTNYSILILCGEGGGSKSGTWFSSVVKFADSLTHGDFYNKCYAMTTISGSSFGAFSVMAHKKAFPDTNITEGYLRSIFQHDYLQHSVTDIMTYDFLMSLFPIGKPYEKFGDRNVHLQAEEVYMTTQALERKKYGKDWEKGQISMRKFRDTSVYFKPMSEFYRTNGQLSTSNLPPLFIPATCRINDGKRGIAMPFEHDSTFFIDAIDIIGQLQLREKNLSMITAVNNSELFPVISAASFQSGLGSFIDGGSFENKGLSTGFDIYKYLSDFKSKHMDSKNDTLKHFAKYATVKIISIGIYKPRDLISNDLKYISQIYSTPTVAMNSPFSGHTDYAFARSKRDLKDNFIPIILEKNDSILHDSDVVMSRWISNNDFDYLHNNAQKILKVDTLKGYINTDSLIKSIMPKK